MTTAPPEKPPADEALDLIRDARAMAAYAARVGKLKAKSLLTAIQRLEGLPQEARRGHPAFVDLMLEVNALAKAIAPVTLADLSAAWRPFPDHQHDRVMRPAIAGISAVLLLVLGYFTFIYSQAKAIQADLTTVQQQDIYAKAEDLYNLSFQVKYLGFPPTPPQIPDPDAVKYFQTYDHLKNLQDELFRSTSRADSLIAQSELAPVVVLVSQLFPSKAQDAKGKLQAVPLDLTSIQISSLYDNNAAYGQTPPAATPAAAAADSADGTRGYYNRMVDYLYRLGITSADPPSDSTVEGLLSERISRLNNIISIYGLWLLPALYALFGAMFFQLRSLMKPLLPNPNLILARAALAAMAGVSISWVFASFVDKTAPGGITVFGLAFLFGYSIDVFFSALDRLTTSVSNTLLGRS
ncbi:hypothetical protein [Phenylobacterium sp.]|jgi:hypothetical protein|uniref:hypothetical protein n=1 Tax=Phenylobacterium sp. TaxID=1871053 RepID=UPI002F401C6C